MFARRSGFAVLLAALCLGGQTVHAQVSYAQAAPVQYWLPGWPFGGDAAAGARFDSYGNAPSFDGTRDSGFFSRRYSFANNWSSLGGGFGLNMQGTNAYGSLGSLYTEGAQYGYKFKSGVSLYGGFDTLKYDRSGPFAAFDARSGTSPAYRANAGVEFQPAPNVSLSFGVGYTQQQSGRVDSDINSPLVPGATPSAFSSGLR